MTQFFGAEKRDWKKFIALGLTADLLPVVSNPDAEISETSRMKTLGKTPSKYNSSRKVVGCGDWTAKQSNLAEVNLWAEERDYGICLQTRDVRALDIDVEDEQLAKYIKGFIADYALKTFPERYRANSGKTLLLFRIEEGQEGYTKRTLKTDGGMIEFLAKGQQCIVAGAHFTKGKPSGERYKINWNGHDDFPLITAAEFEKLWSELDGAFGIAPVDVRGSRHGKGSGEKFAVDETLDKLEEKGLVLEYGKEGQGFITCPWIDNHSVDNGPTQTAYFPRGTRGYAQGHFVCLHAGCATKTDEDFVDALGLLDGSDFEVLAPLVNKKTGELVVERPRLNFIVNKTGEKEAVLHNVVIALENPDYCDSQIVFDKFRDEILIAPKNTVDQWQPMTDVMRTKMRLLLERRGFKPLTTDMMRSAVELAADMQQMDSAITWLESLPWDGVERIDTFAHKYFGAADSKYTQAVSRYMWSALAGRVLVPGIKADMAPVLQGLEGTQKSSAIAALVPHEDFFTEISFADDDIDNARKMRGRLVCEIAELRGLQTAAAESILTFMSRRFEGWTQKFKEFNHTFPRRCLMIGTTNRNDFLDEGQHRRWLPLKITRADAGAVTRDRLQLWAEARELFKRNGICWQDAEALARDEHKDFEAHDSWEDVISVWLNEDIELSGEKPGDAKYIKLHDIFSDALHFDVRHINRRDEMRLGKVLRKLGYEKSATRDSVTKRLHKVWVKKQPNPPPGEFDDLV